MSFFIAMAGERIEISGRECSSTASASPKVKSVPMG